MKIDLDKIIRQGNQKEIQNLFDNIFDKMRNEFTEENIPGLTTYMLEKTLRAFNEWILETEYEYNLDLNQFGDTLKREIDEYVEYLKQSVKEPDPLFKKAKEALC